MELVIVDMAHITNKDTEDLYKISTTKKNSSAVIQKEGKKMCFGCGKIWHERLIQSPAWRKNYFLDVKRKIIFRDRAKTINGKDCYTICKGKTRTICTFMRQVPLPLNRTRVSSSWMESVVKWKSTPGVHRLW